MRWGRMWNVDDAGYGMGLSGCSRLELRRLISWRHRHSCVRWPMRSRRGRVVRGMLVLGLRWHLIPCISIRLHVMLVRILKISFMSKLKLVQYLSLT